MIDYGAAIDSVQFSSKSELSSRLFGRLKFLDVFSADGRADADARGRTDGRTNIQSVEHGVYSNMGSCRTWGLLEHGVFSNILGIFLNSFFERSC